MNEEEIRRQIEELDRQIAQLPAGSISAKTISGRVYYYHRWYENRKRKEKYIPADQAASMRGQIARRKALETQRRKLQEDLRKAEGTGYRFVRETTVPYGSGGTLPPIGYYAGSGYSYEFRTLIRAGRQLHAFADPVREWKRREIYRTLSDYIFGEFREKVFILYGLRRTGKTTMIRQILTDMNEEQLGQTAFLQVRPGNTVSDVNADLQYLETMGIRYLFLDEVTLMEDFIEGAALFSDIFAASGMRIVLSGTDSLGFLFAEDTQLYDRCILLHTTFIPYREFEDVLGLSGIDEYIQYGGTMSRSGIHYNIESVFADVSRSDEYVDTAIAHNIQHSLRCYQRGGHFRGLLDLYEKNELTSAVNRVVEDINHRFTLEVLTREFRSTDLSISAGNLRRDRRNPTDILDRIDIAAVTERLKNLLEIRNQQEQRVTLEESHAEEIREYLCLLDLIQEIDVVGLPDGARKRSRTVISQPGLRWSQADSLVQSLLLDETFSELSLQERNEVLDRIRSEIRGRMLEDIVLLETQMARQNCEVFTAQFAVGEFDMVVYDPDQACCWIYEIKHSPEAVLQQRRHLLDARKCADTEHRYGPIRAKMVLYRGESCVAGEVTYQNVEEYLKGLKYSSDHLQK